MLIGIDASRATVAQRTGTENYTRNLIRALLALLDKEKTKTPPHYRYRLYFRDQPAAEILSDQVDLCIIPFPRLWTHLRLAWEMHRHPPDLLFVPAHVLPPVRPWRSLVTVHDLGYRHFPQTHRPLDRLYLDLSTRWNARAATRILADSEATKADLIGEYGTPAEKIVVVYPGRDENLCRVEDAVTIAAVRAKYNIASEYILYLGTLHPRKNLCRLIEAFATCLPHLPTRPPPLVIGGKKGWLYSKIFDRVQALGLTGHVVFTGYVAEADLPALLSGAQLFAFPSLHEGFGFPVLEAMSCGVPVVCSNTSSLPEVVGDAALLIDPLDTSALAAALDRLLTDEPLRAALVARGYRQAQRFSWEETARQVLSIFEELT